MRISQREYKKRTKRQWKGVRVRTLIPLQNSLAKIPKGTLCTIINKSGGFSLETDPCPTCGIQFFIDKVPPGDVEEVGHDPSMGHTG